MLIALNFELKILHIKMLKQFI